MSSPERKEIQVFGYGDKVRERKLIRKGHVARRRWEEISHLNQVAQFGGEKEK